MPVDRFSGYSPCKLRFEFERSVTYLEDSQTDDESPIVYRYKKNDTDFEEDERLRELFTPSRSESLHVKYENIVDYGTTMEKAGKGAVYRMANDPNVLNTPTLLDNLKQDYENNNLSTDNLTEDDMKYNITKAPSLIDPDDGDDGNLRGN